MRTTEPARSSVVGDTKAPSAIIRTLRTHPGLAAVSVVLSVAVATALVARPVHLLIASVCVAGAALAADMSGVRVVPHLLVLACFGESLGVGSLTVGRLLAIVGLAAVIARFRPSSGRTFTLDRRTTVPVAVLVIVQLLGGFWALDWHAWVFSLGQTGLALCYFFTFAVLVVDPRQLTSLLRTLCLGALAAAAVGFGQALTGLRATGLQGDANIYAMYQVAAVPACLALARARHGRARSFWLVAIVPLLGSIVASQSRGAFGALVVTVVLTGLVLTPSGRRLQVVGALVCALAVTTWAALSLTDRFDLSRIQNDRASGRLDLWVAGWNAFTAHPFTGLGSGGFKSVSVQLLTTDPDVQLVQSHLLLLPDGIEVHSVYLEALTDRGLPGLLALLWLLAATAQRLLRVPPRWVIVVTPAFSLMLVAFTISAAFLSVNNSKLLWLLVGIASATAVPRSPAPSSAATASPPSPSQEST